MAGLGAFAAWLGLCLARDRRSLPRTPLDAPLAWLAAAVLLSALFSLDKPVSLLGQYYSYSFGMLPWFLAAALFYAAAASAAAPWRRVLAAAAAVGAALGLYGLLQRLGIEPLAGAAVLLPREEACGTGGSPIGLGAYLVLLLPAAVRLSLCDDSRGRLLGLCSAVLMGLCLLASDSFAAMLSGLAAGTLAVLLARPAALKRIDLKTAGWTLALAVLVGPVLAARLQRPPDEARLKTWAVAARTFLHRPLSGSGPDTLMLAFRRYRTDDVIRVLGDRRGGITANNDLIQVAATLGLPGLAAYLFFLWGLARLIRDALRDSGRRELAAAAGAAAAGLFIFAKYYALPPPVLICAAAGVGLVARKPGRGGPPSRERRLGAWAALAGTGLACVLLARLCLADAAHARALIDLAREDSAGAVAGMEKACRLAPQEMHYKVSLNRLLVELSQFRAPAEEPVRLSRAVEIGESSVRWHPGDPAAHNMLGVSLLLLSSQGGPDRLSEAQRALDRAQELDPYFIPLWQARLMLASKRNDRRRFEELYGGLQRVAGLLPEDQKLPSLSSPEDMMRTQTPRP